MKLMWCFLAIYSSFHFFALGIAKDIDADVFAKDFYEHFKTFYETNRTDEVLEEMRNEMIHADERSVQLIGFPLKANARVCLKCYIAVFSFIDQLKINSNNDKTLMDFMKKLCIYGNIDDEETCTGKVDITFQHAKFIFANKPNLTVEYVCASVLPEYFCMRKDETFDQALTVEQRTRAPQNEYHFISTGNLTVLHLSDFHYDPHYKSGSKSKCDQWMCCHGDVVPPDSNVSRAGYWGDFNFCDSPARLIENILQQVASLNYHIDFIYFTGDFADHFEWNITQDRIKNSISFITGLLKKYLPNIPIYPILGNHEGYPANFFSPHYIEDAGLSSKWLYKYSADTWKDWLSNEAYETFINKGYYTMLIRPKLRLVALNSNVYNVDNLWIVYDELSYQEQLLWFIDILKNATSSGERIHIISHIGSNYERCGQKWREDFKRIIHRYSDTIAGHFIGHSHLDEFVVYYSDDNLNVPINVAWNGGSGTNFVGLNSNFKFVYIDDKSYDVVDFETWIFNLTEANLAPGNTPNWYKEYSFKSFFEVEDLSPASIHKLVNRFRQDKSLLKEYWKKTVKQSDEALKKGCDDVCLQKTLDSITRINSERMNYYMSNETNKSVITF